MTMPWELPARPCQSYISNFSVLYCLGKTNNADACKCNYWCITCNDETRVVVRVIGHDADALVLLLLNVVAVLKQEKHI